MKNVREIVEELDDRLRKTDQPYLTLPWTDFYDLCERERIKQPFQDSIHQEALGRSLTVAYGQNVVVVCPDRDIAPAPNWIVARASCQIDTVFEDLLKDVQRGVVAMNKLPADERWGQRKYVYENPHKAMSTVYRTNQFGNPLPTVYDPMVIAAVIFEKDAIGERIRIRQNLTRRGTNQHVTPRWSAEKQSCELIWGDETDHPLGVQEVSQKALEPLFFDTDQ